MWQCVPGFWSSSKCGVHCLLIRLWAGGVRLSYTSDIGEEVCPCGCIQPYEPTFGAGESVVLGSIEYLAAVIPVGQRDEDEASLFAETIQAQCVHVSEDNGACPVELSHLEGEEKEMTEKLLWEECDFFVLGKWIMAISLTCKWRSIWPTIHTTSPRPLYEEVLNFINDLISNNWVCELTSVYSSPIVCVRKYNGSF